MTEAWQVTAPYFCAGFILGYVAEEPHDGAKPRVLDAAPILRRHLMGMTIDSVLLLCLRKGWGLLKVCVLRP